MSRLNSPLVKLDIFFKYLLNCKFISAKSLIFVLAQVLTHLLIYIFWFVYNNGFRIINFAFVFGIGKECVPMANVRAKRYGPRMSLDFDQKDDVRTILLLFHLFERRVWMIFVKRVCQKDDFRIRADPPKKKMPPTQRD